MATGAVRKLTAGRDDVPFALSGPQNQTSLHLRTYFKPSSPLYCWVIP